MNGLSKAMKTIMIDLNCIKFEGRASQMIANELLQLQSSVATQNGTLELMTKYAIRWKGGKY